MRYDHAFGTDYSESVAAILGVRIVIAKPVRVPYHKWLLMTTRACTVVSGSRETTVAPFATCVWDDAAAKASVPGLIPGEVEITAARNPHHHAAAAYGLTLLRFAGLIRARDLEEGRAELLGHLVLLAGLPTVPASTLTTVTRWAHDWDERPTWNEDWLPNTIPRWFLKVRTLGEKWARIHCTEKKIVESEDKNANALS